MICDYLRNLRKMYSKLRILNSFAEAYDFFISLYETQSRVFLTFAS
jgi:hypothetical protein